jgi:hypothetical protein
MCCLNNEEKQTDHTINDTFSDHEKSSTLIMAVNNISDSFSFNSTSNENLIDNRSSPMDILYSNCKVNDTILSDWSKVYESSEKNNSEKKDLTGDIFYEDIGMESFI